MGCDQSSSIEMPKAKTKNASMNDIASPQPAMQSQSTDFGYFQFSDHYRKLMENDLTPDQELKKMINTLQIHDRQDWQGFKKYEAEGGKAYNQNNHRKSLEMFIQCQKCVNHANGCFNISCQLQILKQPRLNVIVHKFARKILSTASQQMKDLYEQKNETLLKKYEQMCNQKDPLKRNLKTSQKYWKLYKQLIQYRDQKNIKKALQISQQLIKLLPCTHTGYFQQNFISMNYLKSREIDYQKSKRNILALQRFWKPPFNQPISEDNKKLCLHFKGFYSYLTGQVQNVRGKIFGLQCQDACENKILRWQQKIKDFDKLLAYWNKHKVLKMGYAKNSHSQKRLKWQILSPIPPKVKFTFTDDLWIMQRQSVDVPLPTQVTVRIEVLVRGVSHFRNGIIPLQPYTGNDPIIKKYTSLQNTKADKKFIDMINNFTKGYKTTGQKWDIALQKLRQKVKYEKTQDYKTLSELWQRGKGVCQQFSKLGEAIGRILGIPSRYVAGYAYFNPKQGIALHSMCQIYSQPLGKWIVAQCQTTLYGTNISFVAYSETHGEYGEDCVEGVYFYRNSQFISSSRQYVASTENL